MNTKSKALRYMVICQLIIGIGGGLGARSRSDKGADRDVGGDSSRASTKQILDNHNQISEQERRGQLGRGGKLRGYWFEPRSYYVSGVAPGW